MVYTPVIISQSTLKSGIYRNVHSLVSTYAVSNTTVQAAQTELPSTFPCYILSPAETISVITNVGASHYTSEATVAIDVFCDSKQGWAKLDSMIDSIMAGAITETDALRTARLVYTGYDVVNTEAIPIHNQQIFHISLNVSFKVLI